jgi:glyoxylase-like metal-dependent hydrolase (beta-lactamase superfamily II)
VYACIHKSGGAAYSNAGIINLGDRTILVDAFDTMVAGRDLRQTAEALFMRPVDTIILTHPHSDHWIGASVFGDNTALLASNKTRKISLKWGKGIVKEFKNPAKWDKWIKEMEMQVQTEGDERVRNGLEKSIIHTRYVMAEMAEFQPRYADRTYEGSFQFQGDKRNAELRSLGRGHSEEDAVLLLPQDKIAFIGDVGFFDTQPFLGYCDIALYRQQMLLFQDSEFKVLVPGHGPVGSKDNIAMQLKYLDIMEDLVGNVVQRGGSFKEAMQITLPEPFSKWLVGGMVRFEANVRYLFKHFGGEAPKRRMK